MSSGSWFPSSPAWGPESSLCKPCLGPMETWAAASIPPHYLPLSSFSFSSTQPPHTLPVLAACAAAGSVLQPVQGEG